MLSDDQRVSPLCVHGKELRRAAALDELRDAFGMLCPLGSDPHGYFEEKVLAASDCLGIVAAFREAEGPPPRLPKGLQSPIRSVAAARRTSDWPEWREKVADKAHRVFIAYSSTKVVPARDRRDLIQKFSREKVLALDLVVPFVQNRDADGNPTRKKARTTAGD